MRGGEREREAWRGRQTDRVEEEEEGGMEREGGNSNSKTLFRKLYFTRLVV